MSTTCEAVRNQVLALPDPRRVPAALRAHVADCPGCRAWAERAARLETLLEQLPVPPAPAGLKDALVEDLTRNPVAEPARRVGWVRRNAVPVGGLAAAVLVAAGGWWLSRGDGARVVEKAKEPPRDPFLERVVRRDVALAQADTPAKKLRALGGLADDLSAEACGLSRLATPAELRDVAKLFAQVVDGGLVRHATNLPPHAMPPAERKKELEAAAGKLGEAAEQARLAAGASPPEAKPILEGMEAAARKGQQKLRELAGP